MEYNINPAALGSVFMLPCDVVDKHIKLASAVQLKVILFFMRNAALGGLSLEKISEAINAPLVDVKDAMSYWTAAGVLLASGSTATAVSEEKQKNAKIAAKPTRDEVIKRGGESEEIAYLLREAQMKFGTLLKPNEMSTLVWLYDHEGMKPSVILLLIEFAKSQDRLSAGYIERTALSWVKDGVETISQAEQKICDINAANSAWGIVSRAFSIDKRRPSETELKTAFTIVETWNFKPDMLRLAYDKCVDSTSKFSLNYTKKILEGFYKQGIKTSADLAKADEEREKIKKSGKNSFAGYDPSTIDDLFNK